MNAHQDNAGTRLGMWIFLLTEIMLFGGLFILYAVYYHRYSRDFMDAGRHMELVLGAVNTAILLTSSFFVAAAVEAAKGKSGKKAMLLLGITVLLGAAFLFNKYLEWSHHFFAGYHPGSEQIMKGPQGQSIFLALYFTLTGLHALHVIIGISLLASCMILVSRGRIAADRMNVLENTGLFWHLVDIIWIFLFPLFYLLL